MPEKPGKVGLRGASRKSSWAAAAVVVYSLWCSSAVPLHAQQGTASTQRPDNDSLVAELRALRAEIRDAAMANTRALLLMGGLLAQDRTLAEATKELFDARANLTYAKVMQESGKNLITSAEAELASKPGSGSEPGLRQMVSEYREKVAQDQQKTDDAQLRVSVAEQTAAAELARWQQLCAALDALERELVSGVRPRQ